jgi:hypothetical protein
VNGELRAPLYKQNSNVSRTNSYNKYSGNYGPKVKKKKILERKAKCLLQRMLPENRLQGEPDQWAETKMGPPQHVILLCS